MNQIAVAADAMRSRFEIVVRDADRPVADLRAAAEEALAEIAAAEQQLSVHRPGADLARVNATAADHPVRVDARLFAFLQQAAGLSAATAGAFDPTVGPLLALWGIGGDRQSRTEPPTSDEISASVALVGMSSRVRLNPDELTVAFDRNGVRLDPGAIGKGWALDRASESLRESGIRHALLHGGTSSVVAFGDDAHGNGWRVAVRDPCSVDKIATHVRLRNAALSVSTTVARATVDPSTGSRVEGVRLAVTVAFDAATAEALSTALMVGGRNAAPGLAARFPGASLLFAADVGSVSTGDAWEM